MHLHVSFCYLWFKVHLIMTVSVREYKLCKAWKLLSFGTLWLVIWWIGNVSEEPPAFSFSVSGVSSRHLRNFCTNREKMHDVLVAKTFRTANLKFLKSDFVSTAKPRSHYFGYSFESDWWVRGEVSYIAINRYILAKWNAVYGNYLIINLVLKYNPILYESHSIHGAMQYIYIDIYIYIYISCLLYICHVSIVTYGLLGDYLNTLIKIYNFINLLGYLSGRYTIK
jgi:hypothetical protein